MDHLQKEVPAEKTWKRIIGAIQSFVFTSDHGDMIYSHGKIKKQQPYDESIRVPFLLRYPEIHQNAKLF
ncbi:MAG: sulfatase-like hydrolase/transferase [Draconibacterium sp.]